MLVPIREMFFLKTMLKEKKIFVSRSHHNLLCDVLRYFIQQNSTSIKNGSVRVEELQDRVRKLYKEGGGYTALRYAYKNALNYSSFLAHYNHFIKQYVDTKKLTF